MTLSARIEVPSASDELVLVAVGGDGLHAGVELDVGGVEARGDGVGKLLQAAGKRGEHGRARAGRGLRTACAFLRFIMPRTRLRCFFSMSVNMGKVLRRLRASGSPAWMPAMSGPAIFASSLGAHAAADEGAKALVGDGGVAADEDLEAHAQLAGPGDELRAQDGEDHGGGHEHHALGHGVKLALAQDVGGGRCGVVGADELVAEAELAAEVEGGALLGEEGVGAAFDEEALAGVGDDLSAEVVGGFEQKIVGVRASRFLEGVRGREAGDSTADDDCLWRHAVALSVSIARHCYSWERAPCWESPRVRHRP